MGEHAEREIARGLREGSAESWRALYDAFAAGKPSPLAEPAIQYADYAVWQRDWLQGAVLEKLLKYWKRQLDGVEILQLPTDRKRPTTPMYHGAR